jgi:hypothetical protein
MRYSFVAVRTNRLPLAIAGVASVNSVVNRVEGEHGVEFLVGVDVRTMMWRADLGKLADDDSSGNASN